MKKTDICQSFSFGIRRLPIFPTQFRNGRAALPQERLPRTPLLIGCSPPCIPHRGRSAPSHLQPSNTLRVSRPVRGPEGRETLEAQKARRTAVRLVFVVSGGYLSFRPLRTWSLCVGPGGPSFSSLCLSISPSLLRPLDAVGPDVSQAKAFHALART